MTSVSISNLQQVKIHAIERGFPSFVSYVNQLIADDIDATGSTHVKTEYKKKV